MLPDIGCPSGQFHNLAWQLLRLMSRTPFLSDTQLAIEPRVDSACCRSTKSSHAWPQPAILGSISGKLRLVNPSAELIFIKKNGHICQARLITNALTTTSLPPDVPSCNQMLTTSEKHIPL